MNADGLSFFTGPGSRTMWTHSVEKGRGQQTAGGLVPLDCLVCLFHRSVCVCSRLLLRLTHPRTHSLTLTRAMEKSFTLGQVLSAGAVGLLTGFLISHTAIVSRPPLFFSFFLVPDIVRCLRYFLTASFLFFRFSRSKSLQRPRHPQNRTGWTRKRRNRLKNPPRIQSPL